MGILQNENLLKEDDLKEILKELQSGASTWQHKDHTDLIQSMMLHIGSLDSELRDDLIYGSFYDLIHEKTY